MERMQRKVDEEDTSDDCREMLEQLCQYLKSNGKCVTLNDLEQIKREKL